MPDYEKPFDFEERTFLFAKRVRAWIKSPPRTICNLEDAKQLVRASGSVAANYVEANEAVSRKDFQHKARISRREAKESKVFLRLIDTNGDPSLDSERDKLIAETIELIKILSKMIGG